MTIAIAAGTTVRTEELRETDGNWSRNHCEWAVTFEDIDPVEATATTGEVEQSSTGQESGGAVDIRIEL